jgi:hypothetical protein
MDLFWHYHILDTIKYAEDCALIFGRFLHHFPYLGLRGDEDASRLRIAWQQTQALYALEFGVPMNAGARASSCDDSPEVCGPDPDSCAPEPSCAGVSPRRQLRPRPIRIAVDGCQSRIAASNIREE